MDYPQTGLQNVDFSGGLGGLMASQNQMDAEKMRGIEMEGKGLANTFQGLQNERYGQATPLEMQKLGGEAQSAESKGMFDKQTMDSKVKTALSEYAAGKSKAELEQTQSQMDMTLAKLQGAKAKYLQADARGQGSQVAVQLAAELGYGRDDPEMQQQIATLARDPKKFREVLDHMIETSRSASTYTAKHLQEMDKVGATNASHEKIAAGNNAATLGAAGIHANASKEAAAMRMNKPESVDQMVADATRILADPNATPEQRATAENIINTVRQTKLYGNPAAFQPTMDMEALTKGKVPMRPSPLQQAQQGTAGKSQLPAGWTQK